jgi:hypothetical protein
MIPVFKSNFSIGRSILTLDLPESCPDEDGADSILQIAKENDLNQIVLVEDSMIGFLEAHKATKNLNIHLIYGLRLNCCNDVFDEKKEQSRHKVIVFAKNDNGCKLLNKIYSRAFCDHSGYVDCKILMELWDKNSLKLVIPFYDSYIHNNSFGFGTCLPNFIFTSPHYFVERNNLPCDSLLEGRVAEVEKNPTLVKTILYKKKKDVFAFQTYKCLTNRSFGKETSLSSPNLNHFGSDEFCWESYLEESKKYGRLATV